MACNILLFTMPRIVVYELSTLKDFEYLYSKALATRSERYREITTFSKHLTLAQNIFSGYTQSNRPNYMCKS